MHRLLALVLVAAAGVLAACGSSNDSSSSSSSGASAESAKSAPAPAAGQKVALEADGDGGLYFEQRKLKAKAGAVTLVMEDPSGSGRKHGIAIEGHGVDKDGPIVHPGSKSRVTATLKPGKYEYYCPVPGHEAAGMKGTLTVS